MDILKFIFVMLEVIILFNLLIFVHELGHFLAARWRGLKVDRFAIWFGKPIWKTKYNGVEYVLGSIPAGGYVSLPQMATMEAIEGKSESSGEQLPPISPLDKIIVAFAGPLFSFGLALVFAMIVWVVGRPVSEGESKTIIGYVEEGGPADKAGLKPGDEILSVDGKSVSKFGGMGDSVTWRIVRSEGATVEVKVKRDKEELVFNPVPVKDATKAWQRKSLRQIKIGPLEPAYVRSVITNSPAALAGLKPGDEITKLNGERLFHVASVFEYVEANPTNTLTLTVKRGTNDFSEVSLKPETPVSPPGAKPLLGIQWELRTTLVHPGPIEQVRSSVDAMLSTFGALFAPKSDIKPQHLGGAVKIGEVYYRLFSSEQGWRLAIWFSVLMNVNLAILNLLPLPVLDGGHITLAIVEWIRRKPVSGKVIGIIQTGCAALLIGFMIYIFFYDVQELPWKRSKKEAVPVFAPKQQP